MKVKPTILFLPDILGTSQELNPLMDIIKEKGFETLTFNFAGHGKVGSMPNEFRIDFFARELEQFCKNHQNLIVFGHGLGGYIALYHKANFEDSPLRYIFTYGTKFNWSEEAVLKEIPLLDPDYLRERSPLVIQNLMEKHGDNWKQLLKSTAHMFQNLERLDGLSKEDLNDIDIPVTLILGDQDHSVSNEEMQLTKGHIPHSKVRFIGHSQHDLDKTNLNELSKVLLEELILN